MFSEVFLHIGTEKTGSTSIQRFLATNRDEIEAQGFIYPVSLGATNHHLITLYSLNDENAQTRGNRRLQIAASRALRGAPLPDRAEIHSRFERELERAGAQGRKLIISSEHLHSRITERDEFLRLKSFLSKYAKSVCLVAYLRRQDRVARSLTTTHVKGGGAVAFPEADADSLPRYFDYYRIIKEYETYLEPDRMVLRVFDKKTWINNDLLADFCAAVGVAVDESFVATEAANQALAPEALRFLATMGKYIPQHLDGKPNPRRRQLIKALVREYGGGRGMEVDRATARTFYEAFRHSNERLSAEYFHSTGSIFDEDFSEYPEKISQSADTVESNARIFGHLWNRREEKIVRLQIQNLLLEGQLHLKDGKNKKATKCFREVLALKPKHPEAMSLMAQCQSDTDEH